MRGGLGRPVLALRDGLTTRLATILRHHLLGALERTWPTISHGQGVHRPAKRLRLLVGLALGVGHLRFQLCPILLGCHPVRPRRRGDRDLRGLPRVHHLSVGAYLLFWRDGLELSRLLTVRWRWLWARLTLHLRSTLVEKLRLCHINLRLALLRLPLHRLELLLELPQHRRLLALNHATRWHLGCRTGLPRLLHLREGLLLTLLLAPEHLAPTGLLAEHRPDARLRALLA